MSLYPAIIESIGFFVSITNTNTLKKKNPKLLLVNMQKTTTKKTKQEGKHPQIVKVQLVLVARKLQLANAIRSPGAAAA